GYEYAVRTPLRNDQHEGSFKINWKKGEWGDFAMGESGGDLISLVAYLGGISQVDAARELAATFGIPVPKLSGTPASANAEKRDANLVMPAPADAPAPPTTHPTRGRPNQSWPYKDAAGGVIGYVLRFDGADGKEFRPLTLWRDSVSGRLEWRWESCGLQELADRPVAQWSSARERRPQTQRDACYRALWWSPARTAAKAPTRPTGRHCTDVTSSSGRTPICPATSTRSG